MYVDSKFINSATHSRGRLVAYEYVIQQIENKLCDIEYYDAYDIKSLATLCLLIHQSLYDTKTSATVNSIDDVINVVCDTLS